MKKYFASYWIRSAFYVFLQRFSLTFFGLINFIVLIRHLSKPQMGVWALFLIVVTNVFESTKSALLKNAHIRYVTMGKDSPEKSAIASTSLLINASITFLFIGFILLFGTWLSTALHTGTELSDMLKWFIPGMICMIFFSHFEAIQQSHFDFKGVFAGNLVRQATFFILILQDYLRGSPYSLNSLAIYQGISIMAGVLTLLLFSRKYLLFRFDPTRGWTKKIFSYGGFIFGSGVISTVYSNLDQILTAALTTSPSYVATYNAATRLNNFIDIPSYAAGEILFPKMSQASVAEGVGKVRYFYERMVSILLAVIFPLAVFILLFPKFVIILIAGKQYESAALILQLYILASLLGPLQNQAANTLNSLGRTALCFTLNAVTLAAKLGITFVCLRTIGFYGAAIATLITALLSGIFWYFIMNRQIGVNLLTIFRYFWDNYRTAWTTGMKIIGRLRKVQPMV